MPVSTQPKTKAAGGLGGDGPIFNRQGRPSSGARRKIDTAMQRCVRTKSRNRQIREPFRCRASQQPLHAVVSYQPAAGYGTSVHRGRLVLALSRILSRPRRLVRRRAAEAGLQAASFDGPGHWS